MPPEGRRGPTIALVVPQGFAARLLLRTDILTTLLEGGAKVVVLAPNHDEPYFAEELGVREVLVEPLRAPQEPPAGNGATAGLISYYLRSYTLARGHELPALREKSRTLVNMARERGRLPAGVLSLVLHLLWRARLLRLALARVDARLHRATLHADILDRHRPDLVVTTSPGWFYPDAVVLREAQRRDIATATVVLSWDNPTSKGYRAITPDLLLAWSPAMADQVTRHHDIPRDAIEITGVPHFDRYVTGHGLLSRADLCAEIGLDPERPLVLYATSAPGIFPHNAAVAEALTAVGQVIVRLHPIYFREEPNSAALEAFRGLADRHPDLRIELPGVVSTRMRVDMAPGDADRLAALIRAADAVVTPFSTTTLEAMLVDRPVILVDSTVGATSPPTRRFASYTHLRAVVESGAATVAGTLEEVVALARAALAQPAAGRDARAEVVRRELGPTDGGAGRRTGLRLLALAREVAGSAS